MGCVCSSRRDEVLGHSISSWGCCYNRRCFCGMCAVVYPLSGKRETTTPSLHSASVPQSAGLLDNRCEGAAFPGTLNASLDVQCRESLAGMNVNISEGGPGSTGVALCRESGLTNYERIKDQGLQKEKDGVQQALPVIHKRTKAFGSMESILILPEDEDNCPICLEEYDKENPSIDTLCEHHFHLGCILEWMERSDSCPMCEKEVVFTECP